jgi:hypothetical protein
MTTKKHHPTLSPSAFPALSHCPCYKSDPHGSEAADRGTYIHELIELRSRLLQYPDGVDQDAVNQTEYALQQTEQICIDNGILPEWVEYETPLILLDDNFNEITFGTADVFAPGVLIDYKTGEKHDYHAQMAVYALAAMRSTMRDSCRVYLVYTRLQEIDSFSFTREEAESIVNPIVAAVNNPAKIPVPCSYCKWCADRLECPAINKRAVAVAMGREDWELKNYHSSQILNPCEMSKALDLARLLETWCKSVKAKATEMVLSGSDIPGYVLTERSGAREIIDTQAAFVRSELSPEQFITACDIKLTKLEELYQSAHPDLKKAQAKRELASKLDGIVSTKNSVKYLKPIKGGNDD